MTTPERNVLANKLFTSLTSRKELQELARSKELLHDLLDSIETKLVDLKLGIHVSVSLNDAYSLWFGKYEKRWGFYMMQKFNGRVVALNEVADHRDIFQAVNVLPKLFDELVRVAEIHLVEISEAVTKCEEVLKWFKEAGQ